MLLSRRTSSKELGNLFTRRIASVASWRNKEEPKEAALGANFDQGPEPSGACRNKGRACFSHSLWTVPPVCGHLDLQQRFYGEFLCKSLARPSWGTQWPQEHSVWFCFAPSKWESLWLCPFSPQTQEKWSPAYLRTNLCLVLSNREEKKTLLSSVNCFFVTGTLQRHFSLKCILAEKNPYYRF